jgi:hypothetical protein
VSGKYDDIIGLPHHVSASRPHMPAAGRAAQFAPFAALAGYDAAVKETARITDERPELDEHEKEALNDKLRAIGENQGRAPAVTVRYFLPDEKKPGGAFVTVSGTVKRIDELERAVIMDDGRRIPIDNITEIADRPPDRD